MAVVLVAEDDPDVHVLLEMLLMAAGHTTMMVRDGAAALEVLESSPEIDLVLLDVAMPGEVDGLGATRAIRSRPATADLPVLLLSARSQQVHIQQGLAAGANDYVVKPFDTDALLATITSLLERRAG